MTRIFVLLLCYTALVCAVVAVTTWISHKKALPTSATIPVAATAARSSEDRAMIVAQRRAVAAVALSALVFVILLPVAMMLTGLAGLGIALTAGTSVSAGLLLFSTLPPAKDSSGTTAIASLDPRKPWSFGMQRTFVIPLAIMAAFFLFLGAAGLTSAPDGQGRYRILQIDNVPSIVATSSYPGWFYGIPLILVTLILAITVFLALHRISATPSLPDPRMAALDRRWREISTLVVIRLGTGTLLGYFGGTAAIAGQTMANIASAIDATTSEIAGTGPLQPLFGVGITTAAIGAILTAVGIILLVLAARDALTIRTAARAAVSDPVAV
ncbi:hypothetical protein [Arthrobacter sp. BF1]|uniref:hypothetical protein n=1 Tax=Arthrobacter sp. BF1 TaxID=2821145 RepID=UPI001C50005B|nr:hypothetical protein [Arthrobacter sp. BF1]